MPNFDWFGIRGPQIDENLTPANIEENLYSLRSDREILLTCYIEPEKPTFWVHNHFYVQRTTFADATFFCIDISYFVHKTSLIVK